MTPHDIRASIAAEINRQGISQNDLAQLTGISQGNISRYLNNADSVSAVALRLLDALGLELTVAPKGDVPPEEGE